MPRKFTSRAAWSTSPLRADRSPWRARHYNLIPPGKPPHKRGLCPYRDKFGTTCAGWARSKTLWGVLLLAVLWGYGYAMNTPAVDMDDLAIATYQQGGEFLRQGRITVWLLQALTGIMTYQRFWPELFFALSLVLAGILLAAVLYTAARRQAKQPGGAAAGGRAAAVALPWRNFDVFQPVWRWVWLPAVRVGIGAGTAAPAVRLAEQPAGACGAVVCLCFALGLYESFAPVWLTLLCAALLLDAAAAEPHSRKAGKIWGSILRGLWPLAAALVLRKGLAALLCAANGVSGQDGTASKTIFWFQRDSVRAAVVIPVREWLTNYLARAFGIPALALLATCQLGGGAVGPAAPRRQWAGTVCGGADCIAVLAGHLAGHRCPDGRAVQCFAVFVPFAAWLWLAPALDRGKQGGAKAIICAALAGAMLAVELISLTGTIRYNRDRWQYEERLLIKTADELNDLDPAGTLPVAFVGQAELSPELQDRLVIPAATRRIRPHT